LSEENGYSTTKSLKSTSGPLLAISTYVSTDFARDDH
jgi:hypothetical protein